ncbi:MAG: SbcC/MukB-like Walker B domain-containing protein [bacterium]
MKILELRFKNLNSLVGEWLIDFNAPEYISDGIFAITGATGVGKTSILDAICLALYGETPRLGKITKSSNEIMSRQTAECFAEICFETKEGQFRCIWSQHRSRKKADGDLQAPKHEISNANTGQILESKIKDVDSIIRTKIGMDFKQFTRSILLAQGGFAAFLHAKTTERASILEQITGTEIYTNISMRIHERRSSELRKLELLKSELSSIELLSEEAFHEKELALSKSEETEKTLNKEIDVLEESINKLKKIASLKESLAQSGKRLSEYNSALEKNRTEELKNITERIFSRKKELETNKEKLFKLNLNLTNAVEYLEKNKQDEILIAELSSIKDSFLHYQELSKTKEEKNKYLLELEQKLNTHRKLYAQASQSRDEKNKLKDKLVEALPKIKENQFRLLNIKKSLLDTQIKNKKNNLEALTEKLKIAEEQKNILNDLVESLESEKILLSKISDLETERKKLEEGKPCPLCGSTNHPYTKGELPLLNKDFDNKFTEAKNKFKNAGLNIISLEKEKISLEKDLEYFSKELNSCLLLIQTEKDKFGYQIEDFISYTSDNTNPESSSISSLDKISKDLENLKIEEENLLNTKDKLISEIEIENNKLNRLKDEGLKMNSEFKLGQERVSEIEEQILSMNKALTLRLEPFKLSLFDTYESAEKTKQNENVETKDIENYEKSLEKSDIEQILHKLQDKLNNYNQELRIKNESESLIIKLNDENENIQTKIKAIYEEHLELKTYIEEKLKSLETKQASTEFLMQKNLEELEQEYKQIIRIKQNLEKDKYSTEVNIHTLNQDLQKLFQIVQKPLEEGTTVNENQFNELISEKNLLTEQKRNLLEEIGSLKRELKHNLEAKDKYFEKTSFIEAQQKEYERFNKLHSLIGHSEGKKYREFVQALSFEMVIYHANKQLESMFDRYLLIMDKDMPLELNVIDNYQAGEIRSTKNLSGGESFIISLALALGLSKIVSSKVNVDSLFLDEGFGTLDSEALEIALETLSNLKQTGKLIGIISHMEALKERIPTQIKVESVSGGKSVLSGAGVKKLSF